MDLLSWWEIYHEGHEEHKEKINYLMDYVDTVSCIVDVKQRFRVGCVGEYGKQNSHHEGHKEHKDDLSGIWLSDRVEFCNFGY